MSVEKQAGERRRPRSATKLPVELTHLFWEYDAEALTWERDRDLVIGKILAVGTWNDIRWLRSTIPAASLRRWILRARGRGLSPQQMRYWQLVLDLPDDEVESWLSDPARRIWHGRTRRGDARRRAH
jgi:hypothetical protein